MQARGLNKDQRSQVELPAKGTANLIRAKGKAFIDPVTQVHFNKGLYRKCVNAKL
jgi:hypothetical protein